MIGINFEHMMRMKASCVLYIFPSILYFVLSFVNIYTHGRFNNNIHSNGWDDNAHDLYVKLFKKI